MSAALYFVLGAVAGVVEALSLRRAARDGVGPFAALLRLALVAGVLVLAALGGQLLAGALGWASGLGLCAVVLWWRWS
jgi:hypothetical protein